MSSENPERLDKYLWQVRIFKTRSLATEACKKGRVLVSGMPAKPSRNLRSGEQLLVKKPPVNYSYEVLAIPAGRLPAKDTPMYLKDLTPSEELEKLKLSDSFFIRRDRGTGRPTKKERRNIDKLTQE